ncbi:MAG: entericidin A/B family lipoprotein [Gammaproteobacteria bacterium]|nr:entericidin A/B family lipoprotein [Gammaproteobacteria bacterium]
MKAPFAFISIILLSVSLLAGCEHTVQGFGKDMQTNGEKLESSTSK